MITHDYYASRDIPLLRFKGISLIIYLGGAIVEQKCKALQIALDADPEYQSILRDYLIASKQFQRLTNKLEEDDKAILYAYLGILAEMQMREIELALGQPF